MCREQKAVWELLRVQTMYRLSGIGGLDYWTGILDWNTEMA